MYLYKLLKNSVITYVNSNFFTIFLIIILLEIGSVIKLCFYALYIFFKYDMLYTYSNLFFFKDSETPQVYIFNIYIY